MKKQMRKMAAVALTVIAVACQIPSNVWAEETADYDVVYVTVSDGETSSSLPALQKDGDLYFSASAYGDMTDYEYSQGENIGYTLGIKIVVIDPDTGEMAIPALNYTGDVGEIIQYDENYFISASELLPWLNVECSVENGILYVLPDSMSIWEVLDGLDDSYLFRLYEDYADTTSTVSGLTAMIVFDTVINFRWERLVSADITNPLSVFESGSYYDFECYVSALSEMGVDDTLESDTAKNIESTVFKANKGLDTLETVLGMDAESEADDLETFLRNHDVEGDTLTSLLELQEEWQGVRELISSTEKMTQYMSILSVWKSEEIIMKSNGEYLEYIGWLAEQDTGDTTLNLAAEKADALLDANTGAAFAFYANFGEQVTESIPETVLKVVKSSTMDEQTASTIGTLMQDVKTAKLYLALAKVFYSTVIPVSDGYESMAKVCTNETLQDTCWGLAQNLRGSEMTEENIANMRQSYLVALKSAKTIYEAMQETYDVKLLGLIDIMDGDGLMDYKIQPLEEKITELIYSMDSTENDSIEGKKTYRENLLGQFASLTYTDQTEIFNDFISAFTTWLLWNAVSFDTMTDSMKLDLCAEILAIQGGGTSSEDGQYRVYQNSELESIVNDYIESPPALISENSSEYLGIQEDVSYYGFCDVGYDPITYSIDSVENLGKGQYLVTVIYIEPVEELSKNFTYGTMKYTLKTDFDSKYGCKLVDASWDCTFEGWDAINEQITALQEQNALDIEEMCLKIEQHYTELSQHEGAYACFDSEVEETDSQYVFILRYQMSKAEMEERVANGGYEAANIYVATIWVDKATGSVTDEWDWDTWNMW